MRTIHLETEDHGAWVEALRDSRDETIVVYCGGYRIVLHGGEVLSSSGHSPLDVTPVAVDDVKKRKRPVHLTDVYGNQRSDVWSESRFKAVRNRMSEERVC